MLTSLPMASEMRSRMRSRTTLRIVLHMVISNDMPRAAVATEPYVAARSWPNARYASVSRPDHPPVSPVTASASVVDVSSR